MLIAEEQRRICSLAWKGLPDLHKHCGASSYESIKDVVRCHVLLGVRLAILDVQHGSSFHCKINPLW